MGTFADSFDTSLRSERQLADLQTRAAAPASPADPDPGTFVRKDILTAKGDLYVGTAAAAVGRQAVGMANQVLTADSTTSTGMKWATPSVSVVNKAQRVTTGSIAASASSDVTLTWTSSFADTSYTVVTEVVESTASLQVVAIKTQNAGSVVVTVKNNDAAGAHTGVLHAISFHD